MSSRQQESLHKGEYSDGSSMTQKTNGAHGHTKGGGESYMAHEEDCINLGCPRCNDSMVKHPCGFSLFDMMPPCILPSGHTGEHQDGFGGHYTASGRFMIVGKEIVERPT